MASEKVTAATPEYSSRSIAALFALCSLSALVLLVVVMYQSTHQEWKGYQEEYKALAIEQARETGNPELIAAAERIEIGLKQHQLFLTDLKRIDRCTVCHVGVESDVVQAGATDQKVFAKHPGDYLEHHPIERFGCTICHDGQGLATNSAEAHATRDTDVAGKNYYWDKPLLKGQFLQANCLKCHANRVPDVAPDLAAGKKLFEESGCLGCHQLGGKGGMRGPAFDGIADVSKHVKHVLKDNANHYLHQTYHDQNIAFILESIADPKAQPPDSKMINLGLTEDQELDMAVYLKGLTSEKIPSSLLPADHGAIREDGRSRYLKYCSACHGQEGEGKIYEELEKKPTRLGSPEFLSIATPRLMRRIVETGKRGGVMPAWATTGGLGDEEIDSIVDYMLSWKRAEIPFSQVKALKGESKKGAAIFESNCSTCHGPSGKYRESLIGPSLNNQQFLSVASDAFLYRTIVNGRAETAMPSWRNLSPQDLAHLMAYMKSWRNHAAPEEDVLAVLDEKRSDPSQLKKFVRTGKTLYRRNCRSCHGQKGEGGVGPSLNNQDFLAIADEGFLYQTLARGRAETAMPSFTYLTKQELAAIIGYVKAWQTVPSVQLGDEKIYGSELLGQKIFQEKCVQCHGTYGEGGLAPGILRKGFLEIASDPFIRRMIQKGRAGTAMGAMAKGEHGIVELTDPELDAVVAFMRSQQFATEDIPVSRQYRGIDVNASAARGKVLYERCAPCHGQDGGGLVGPALGNPGFLDNATDGFIIAMTMMGREGTAMDPQGIGSGGNAELDSQQAIDIANYIRDWQDREDVPWRKVQGDVPTGKKLYESNCAQCHGPSGNEGFAPALNNQDFLEVASDGYLQATMALGRWGTPMQSVAERSHGMAQLNAEQINHIIVFLRAQAELDQE